MHDPAQDDDPAEALPTPTAYTLLGGDARVRELVDRFYDLMDLEPAYTELRAAHGPSLDEARDKLYWFLSGWLGGPPLFTQKHGAPMLRARHLPFRIGMEEASGWLACFHGAMTETVEDAELRDFMWSRIEPLALHMRNLQAVPLRWAEGS